MGSYTVEQVEFLRQRADITYEEALAVLERCNGDLTRCLVELERQGRIRKARNARSAAHGGQTYRRAAAYQEASSLGTLLKKLVHLRLVVSKGERLYADLPILYLVIAALCAPHLMIGTVVAMFVLGLKIRFESGAGEKVGDDRFYDTVDKMADNIKSTVSNFTRAAQTSGARSRQENAQYTPYAAPDASEPIADDPIVSEPIATPAASESAASESAASDIDDSEPIIPEVTPYEEFTGTETVRTGGTDAAQDTEESEFTIG